MRPQYTRSLTNAASQRAASLLNDYSFLSDLELADELLGLHDDLSASGRFGLVAGRTLRNHCVGRLGDIGAELSRRAVPRPAEPHLIQRPATSVPTRPTAACLGPLETTMTQTPTQTAPWQSPEWEGRMRSTYRDLSPRQLAGEVAALGQELRTATCDPLTQPTVSEVASLRLRLAMAEIRSRIGSGQV